MPSLLAVILACAAMAGESAASRLYNWKDLHGTTHYGDQPPDPQRYPQVVTRVIPFRNAPGAPVTLRLLPEGAHYQVWADNRLYGPVEVTVRFRQADNVTAIPALPARATVPGGRSGLISRVYPRQTGQASQFEVVMESLPGDPAAKPQDFEYRLPFDYARVRVDQGFGGRFSHQDPQNYYAIDFAVPVGTPVLAARDGVVMQVESDFDKAGLNREKYGGQANFIRIAHDDGSMALYAHLDRDGVQVRAGQRVHQGQRIALSGNTGFTSGPHLHFVVQANRNGQLQAIPFRIFGPLGELKFAVDGNKESATENR